MGKRFQNNHNFIKNKSKVKKKKITIFTLLIIIILGCVIVCFANFEKISDSSFVKAIQKMITKENYIEENLPREKLNFNYGWKFSKGEGHNNQGSILPEEDVTVIPNNSEIKPYESNYTITEDNVGLNNERWEEVSLPHTYNDVDTFNNFNELGGQGQNGERSMYTGTAWYKKTFVIPQEYDGKRIYVEFEAARQAAKVYINGNLLEGTSENGFIAFGYDLTPYINYSGENGGVNEITVMVDNSFKYTIEGTNSTIPWNDSHWHPTHGGLYRNSYLYVIDDLHFTLPLYSFLETEGTYIYTSNETETTARIHVNAEIENSSQEEKTFSYIAEIKDQTGSTVLTMRSDGQVLQPGEKKIFILSDILQDAKRWSDEYPYLYTVVCKIEVNGNIIDNNENELGIRTTRFTTDGGMYLNENYTVLNGWGQKSTGEWAGLASAYPDWMQDYVVQLMKEAGSNYTRYGHTSGGPEQIKASNRYGILVLQPGVDSEGNYGGSYSTATYDLRENAFRDMIIYFRNNPSIVMWEMGNQSNISESCMQNLYNIVKQYDYGNRGQEISKQLESGTSVASSSFLMGDQNLENVGTYDGTTTQSDRLIAIRQGNATSKKYVEIEESTEGGTINMGGMPVIEGEYNRLEARRGVWDFHTTGYENFKNETTVAGYADVTSEEFAVSQVQKYASIISKIQMNGVANWIFSDTTSHGRLGSEVARASGEVDAVMLPKESYWVCKTLFSKTPGIHIIGHWNYEEGTKKDIYVVAKGASSVELKINGVTKEINSSPTDLYLFTFKNVSYEAGIVEAIAKDHDGNVITIDKMETDGTPTKLKITPIVSEQGLLANGSDILLLDVEILDQNGKRCESFDGIRDDIITNFTINDENGCSIWRGGYNSSLENSTNNKYLYIESGITRVAVKTTMKPGDITITAETEGLESDTITIQSKPVDNTNGYCKTLSSNLTYSLEGLEYKPYGDGARRGETDVIEKENASDLISELTYTGETNINIGKALGKDKKIYSDIKDTFDSVPYHLMNAEYTILKNENNGDIATDLINFVAKKEINVYILRDSKVEKPEWLSEFTKQKDIVTSSDGIIYKTYMKTYQAGELITLGGNSNSGAEGKKGHMYVVAIKSKENVQNGVFYQETFDGISNWNIEKGVNTSVVQEDDGEGNNVIHFQDTNTSSLAYISSEYAKMYDKYKFSYRLKLDSSVATNKWIRTWITKDIIENPNKVTETKANVLLEIYANRDTNSLTYRELGINTVKDLARIPSLDQWNTYEYVIDTKNSSFDVYINGNLVKEGAKFWKELDYGNQIMLGTGGSSLNNFWMDDVSITPIERKTITGIKVNGKNIDQFHTLTQSYRVSGDEIMANNHIEAIEGEMFASQTVEYNEEYAKLNVTDTEGNMQSYFIYFEKETVNKTELRSLISKAEGLNQKYYTEQTWNDLILAKQEAELICNNDNATTIEISVSIEKMIQKISQLQLK